MTPMSRGVAHESAVLVRQMEGRLLTLRATRARIGSGSDDLDLAEQLVATLRQLIADTAHASASDRGRVRAAVHYFVGLRNSRDSTRIHRSLADEVRIINDMVRGLSEQSGAAAGAGLRRSAAEPREAFA
jgi:hypothetical protein